MTRLVQGVGVNDRKYPARIDGKITKEYNLWAAMLVRCYDTKYHEKNTTYIGCSVSDNFKKFSYFYEWCNLQIGFNIESYQLDKDLLCKGNKIYNENSCVFLPSIVNSMLIKCDSSRGDLPIGVSKSVNKFIAKCRKYGTRKYIGTFDTPELAFNAYKSFKEAHIKELAEKYKDTIDTRAYQALLNYEVSIDD